MSNEFTAKATIDLHEMDHDDIVELLGKCFDELSFAEKEDFMRLNLDEANNDDIEQYYLDNISSSTEEDDDSLDPCSLENDQRCQPLLAHVSGQPLLRPLTSLSRCITSWDGNNTQSSVP